VGVLWSAAVLATSLAGCRDRTAPLGAEARAATIPSAPFQLTDVAASAGVDFRHAYGSRSPLTIVETMGGGCAWLDFDGDGWLDLFLVSSGQDYKQPRQVPGSRLYRNNGRGGFEDVTARAGIAIDGYAMGCCAGDYDNDGHLDLFVTGFGRNFLLRNRGDGTFADVTAAAGILTRRDAWGMGCSFVDVNRDGRLDLYMANYVVFDPAVPLCRSGRVMTGCTPNQYRTQRNELYLNQDGRFVERAVELGADDPAGAGLGVLTCDFDNDGWADLFVANDGTPNALLHNRKGRFVNVAARASVAFAESGAMRAGMGTDAGDYDGDGLFDLVITNFQHEPNSLYRNSGELEFAETTYPSGIGSPSVMRLGFGVTWVDLDGDGRLDLYVGNGHVFDNVKEFDDTASFEQQDLVLLNGGQRFSEVPLVSAGASLRPSVARGVAAGDFNNDGTPDLLINSLGRPARLLENRRQKPGRWLGVSLRGAGGNRSAIGARVELKGPSGLQVREVRSGGSYLSQADLRALFGLGTEADPAALSLRVRWPSGRWQGVPVPSLDQYLTVEETAGGKE
jgi:hypothetical protein